MKTMVLACALLFATSAFAGPCESWFHADSRGRGVIRVEAIRGKLDTQRVKNAMTGLNPAEWDTLAARLQIKLGADYRVTVLTAAEFEKSGHDCR